MVPLKLPKTTLGRAWVNDIVIDDPNVSRFHAVITLESPFFMIRNLRSMNGLRLNGQLVHARVLMDGDTLIIGGCTLHFIADEEAREAVGVSSSPLLLA
jgi:pSer/pThr/pTyr-binding forkhead associated (FHA) protein